jgi:peptidoglycan/xylan/chitin deacetylase (PgdA/CDA1 family)
MYLKRAIKALFSLISIPVSKIIPKTNYPRVCILVYHRVAEINFVDPKYDDWNVLPDRFEKHVAALSEFTHVINLAEVPDWQNRSDEYFKPIVCITFDDGYFNFYSNVLPILKKYNVKSTLFAVTNSVGGNTPMEFDQWAIKNQHNVSAETWKPIDWNEINKCIESGLVQIGSHSHQHLDARNLTNKQMRAEIEDSRDTLIHHLGEDHEMLYSYPFGSTRLGFVPPEYRYLVRSSGYQLAVTTDLGLVKSTSDLFLLPRVEANQSDTPSALLAKVSGAIHPQYLSDRLRRANRK